MKLAFLTTDNRDAHRQYDQPEPWFGTAMEAVLQGFRDFPGLEVHVVSCTQQPMRAPEKLAANIYFHSLHVPKLGWLRTLYQGCVRATRKKLREIQPDIVHGQGTERDCSASAVLSGFPSVVTIHGNMAAIARQFHAPIGSFLWLQGKLENWTLRRARGVFCNSIYTEELVRAWNPRTWRVPNALRRDFFAPLPARTEKGPPVLLNIGVLSERKRQRELLELGRRLHARGCRFQLLFVGLAHPQESYSCNFLREIAAPGVEKFASFTGFQECVELIATMDRSRACVHFPSEEAFGLVVAEALARNLAFFGSRVGGPVEITQDVEGAELVDVNDWARLEERLYRWLQNDAPRPTTAAQTMSSRYHPQVIAQRHVEIYHEVLAGQAR
jgi:glycosyltransferase involved in cell wall biosynthesis